MATEKRLIDADEFIADLCQEFAGKISTATLTIGQVLMRIQRQPTVEAGTAKREGLGDYYPKCVPNARADALRRKRQKVADVKHSGERTKKVQEKEEKNELEI